MDEAPLPGGADPGLVRYLKRLVTLLTVTMIAGLVVLIALIVIRMQAPPLRLPDDLALPEGAKAAAFTQGRTWVAIVTEDDRILIYDRETGALRQSVAIDVPQR